jgi:hypothetical protein
LEREGNIDGRSMERWLNRENGCDKNMHFIEDKNFIEYLL